MQGVANALGAALGTVGGTYDNIVEVDTKVGEEGLRRARELALSNGITEAQAMAVEKGKLMVRVFTIIVKRSCITCYNRHPLMS